MESLGESGESRPTTPLTDGDSVGQSVNFLSSERGKETTDRIAATQLLEKVRDRERDERIEAMANMFQQRDR